MRELEGAPFRPGGSVMISSREPDVQCFVQDHAPAGWWTEIKDLYQKALDFEMNGLASLRARGRAQGLEQSMRRDSGHVMSSTQKHHGYVGNVGAASVAVMAVVPMPRAKSHGGLAMPHGRTVLGLPMVAVVAMVVVQSISHLMKCVHNT